MNKVTLCLMLGLGMLSPSVCLAVTPFVSASATALGEITQLSDSPADYALSPLIAETGCCVSYLKPFSLADTGVYGVHTAFAKNPFRFATGMLYLDHTGYRWQNGYLCLALASAGWKVGLTQHLVYERISQESWFTWDNDYALGYENKAYGMELRYNNAHSSDAAFSLTGSTRLDPSAKMASTLTWQNGEPLYYALASVYQIAKPLAFQTSYQSEPSRFGCGIKIAVEGYRLQYAVQTHPELSLSHAVDLGFSW